MGDTSSAISGAGQGAMAGLATGNPYMALLGGGLGLMNGLFGSSGKVKNTPPPIPVNYYGLNGSGMFWNPYTNGYVSLDPRMSGADQGALFKYQQMMDSLTGGTGSVKASAMAEANRLAAQIQDPNVPAAMKKELQDRLNTVNETMRTVGDWTNPLGKIGVTDPNRQMEFQKQTGTVQDYLKKTLNQGIDARTLAENAALASRGLGSSSNAQYGADQRARDYGVAASQNEVTANDYLRQLQAADEAKKYQLFGLAQGGAGQIEGKQLSQEQLALNQMMMGMNFGQGHSSNMDAWNRQGAAVDAANKGKTAQDWRDLFTTAMGGMANTTGSDFGSADWWKKFGMGAAGTASGTSPNLWNTIAPKQPASSGSFWPGGNTNAISPAGFNWGSAGGWGTAPQVNGGFSGFGIPWTGGWNQNQPGATPSMSWAFNPNKT